MSWHCIILPEDSFGSITFNDMGDINNLWNAQNGTFLFAISNFYENSAR